MYPLPDYTRTVYYAGARITHISKEGSVDKERLEIDGPITEPLKVVVRRNNKNQGLITN